MKTITHGTPDIEKIKQAIKEYAKESKYVDKTYVQTLRNNSYQGIQKKGGYIDNGVPVSVGNLL